MINVKLIREFDQFLWSVWFYSRNWSRDYCNIIAFEKKNVLCQARGNHRGSVQLRGVPHSGNEVDNRTHAAVQCELRSRRCWKMSTIMYRLSEYTLVHHLRTISTACYIISSLTKNMLPIFQLKIYMCVANFRQQLWHCTFEHILVINQKKKKIKE